MKTRIRRVLISTCVVGVALAVYFEPTHCVRGWFWGEAFFAGRPTSYWRAVVERDLQIDPDAFSHGPQPPPPSDWLRDVWSEWTDTRLTTDSSLQLITHIESDSVLRELMDDGNPNVSGFAKDILHKIRQKEPDERADALICWMNLICKHNLKHQGLQPALVWLRDP